MEGCVRAEEGQVWGCVCVYVWAEGQVCVRVGGEWTGVYGPMKVWCICVRADEGWGVVCVYMG